ncbi:unnamed protein product, partial [Anisakis simplex]|uniref:LRAT domain-containing protein n=1 Tax=Anisakis simplex TaxID=6269 RepID=A0A0M3KA73_ANISI
MIAPNQFTSEWMNAAELTARLELGDRIEIRRVVGRNQRQIYAWRFFETFDFFQHWALFIGYYEDMACVAHVTTNSGDFDVNVTDVINPSDSVVDLTTKFVKGSQAQVQQGELTRVARTDMCRINNSLDRLRRPFPPSIIVTRALLMLGSGGYNILFNN